MTPPRTPLLIGIAGGSGSGKTYLARRVQQAAGPGEVALLSMDQYFRSLTEGPEALDPRDINFDHPGHIDLPLLITHLKALKAGEAITAPSYDFRTQVQTPGAHPVAPVPIVMVEGLFVLAHPLVELFDLTIFLDVEADQRLIGRLLRDMEEREESVPWAIDRYQRFVRPSYQAFVEPTKLNADVVVDFTYRRAFFQELIVHIVTESITDGFDLPALLHAIRQDPYHLGVLEGREGVGSQLDLLTLIQQAGTAAPPVVPPPTEPRRHPRLWVADNPRHRVL